MQTGHQQNLAYLLTPPHSVIHYGDFEPPLSHMLEFHNIHL